MRVVTASLKAVTNQNRGFRDDREADVIAQVRTIVPLLAQHAAANEAAGTLTDTVVALLDRVPGIWSMLVPERLGGLGLSATSVVRVSAELAKGDPAVAWVVQIIGGSTWLASLAPDCLQEDLFADSVPRFCAVFGPPGLANPVPGGYIVSGRWPYASGFRLADWGIWAIGVEQADGSKSGGHFCYIPTSEMALHNSWDTVGLRGTGSDTAIADDVFVPTHRVVLASQPHGSDDARPRHNGAPSDLWAIPTLVGRTGLGQAIGIAEAMFDCVRNSAAGKPLAGTSFTKQSDSPVALREFGEVRAKIDAARLIVEAAADDLDRTALAGTRMTTAERARSRALGGVAVSMIDEVAQKIMFLGGSSAFSNANLLSRYWRDLAIIVRHVQNIPAIGHEVYGRALLNVDQQIIQHHLI